MNTIVLSGLETSGLESLFIRNIRNGTDAGEPTNRHSHLRKRLALET